MAGETPPRARGDYLPGNLRVNGAMTALSIPAGVAAILVAAGCRSAAPPGIGDGAPRDTLPSILDVVQDAFDSATPRIAIRLHRWTTSAEQDLDATTEQATRFAETPGLVGVVGHAGSRISLLASTVYNAEGITQIVPNGTSRRLTEAGPWTFPLVPHDGIEGAALATYALDSLRLTRITVMYFGDEYGIGLRDGVDSVLRARGVRLADQVLVPAEPCRPDDPGDVTRLLARASVRRAPPDVVILAVNSAAAVCLARLLTPELPRLWLLGADGVELSDQDARAFPVDARERLRTVVFGVLGNDSLTAPFFDRTRRILGRDPRPSEALVYDGFMLLAAAIQATGGSREAVRQWVSGLGRSRPPWQGVTGPIGFGAPRGELIRFAGFRGAGR